MGSSSRLDRIRTVLTWVFVPWTAVLCWVYLTAVLDTDVVGGTTRYVLGAATVALAIALPSAVFLGLEHLRGQRLALRALLGLTGALVVSTAAASGVLAALGFTGAFLAAAYGYGAVIAARLDLDQVRGTWQSAPLVIALGVAVLALLGVFTGVAGTMSAPVVAVLCLSGLALAVAEVKAQRTPRAPTSREASANPGQVPATLPVGWWWGFVVLALIGLVGAVAPEVRNDALTAHLPIAREFVTHHAIVDVRQNVANYFQMNGAVLYAMGMLFIPGEAVPKLLHYSAGLLASLVVYDLGRRLWNARTGLVAAGIVASTPLIWWVGGSAYTDLWTVLYAIAAVTALALLAERPSPKRAAVVGLLAGTALGFKLPALVTVLPITACVLWVSAMPSAGSMPRLRLRRVGAFALTATLAGAFWYGRAWLLAGNPVFPLLNAVFKSPYWPVENTRLNLNTFGAGSGFWDLLVVPWRVTRFPLRFVEEGSVGVVYLALLPAGLLAIVRGRTPRWLSGILLASGVLWFFGAQYLRYLLPVCALAAVVGAAGLLEQRDSARAEVPTVAALTALVLGICVTAGAWVASGPPGFPLAAALGAVSRADYAAAYVPGFRTAEYVARTLPAAARLYGVGEARSFYYDRYFVSASRLGRAVSPPLVHAVLRAKRGPEVQAWLRQAEFTHLVVYRYHPIIVRLRGRQSGEWLTREALWEEGPRLDYAYAETYLFDLASQAGSARERGPELLRNAAMAAGPDGEPAKWETHGPVTYSTAEVGADDTVRRIRLGVGAYLVQSVAVTPDSLYALETEAASLVQGAGARLFTEWVDARGRTIDYNTWRQITVGPEWMRYAMACTAPPGARLVKIWLMAVKGGDVMFTRPHFYELR